MGIESRRAWEAWRALLKSTGWTRVGWSYLEPLQEVWERAYEEYLVIKYREDATHVYFFTPDVR